MAKTLHISDELELPLDIVTKTVAILAQRRKGKTYTGSVIAEEMVKVSMPFVALDPTGAWWGLRASADGRADGLPVVILGGQHGDLPLDRSNGTAVADLVLDHPGYYVVDLSLLGSRAAEREFATAFADRLYRRKMHPGMDWPLHLFVDEADMFVPQEKERDENVMLGAFQAIVRRGGLHGLGTTLISQRPALINKNVLTQLDILILLRLVAGNDQDYVDNNYVKRAGTPEQRQALMSSMASLSLGEAWVWEPGSEPPLFDRVKIRERTTFNSSATPRPGEHRVEPTRLAQVDLAAIKEQMAETIERAKADDPKELRKRIALLERRLTEAEKVKPEPEVRVETIEVPVLDESIIAELHQLMEEQRVLAERMGTPASEVLAAIARLGASPARSAERTPVRTSQRTAPDPESVSPQVRAPRAVDRSMDSGNLGKGERTILTAVAQYPAGVTREQLTVLTGYKRSSRDTYLQRLRQASHVVADGARLTATAEGIDALGDDFEPLPTGAALRDHWLATLPEGERRILAVLVEAYPEDAPNDWLSEVTGYKRSSRDTYLQRLRSRQLVVTDRGRARASADLF